MFIASGRCQVKKVCRLKRVGRAVREYLEVLDDAPFACMGVSQPSDV